MRFSKLRLTGFKSFVDPTDLIIADGLTGVVGPNGCGKSNLLEALRWVMGENRPTAVRGGGMEDVIFAGAATRPARNFAEVVLSVDNSERRAPAGFNGHDTLDIVRRITRDVGSAYKVQGKDVRARDVQMLFADASSGAQSPALVRQGQIAELINAKPKNRRRVLEEAAGISGLYQRRHEAELKLNSAATNLARVDDVLEQLASQLAQLARQAKQAARYRDLGDALRQAEGALLYRRWREADDAHGQAEAALRGLTTSAAQAQAAVLREAKLCAAAEEAMPEAREEAAVAGAVFQRLIVERDTLTQEVARAEAAVERLQAQIAQMTQDMEREAALNHDADQTISRLSAEAASLDAASAGHNAKLAAAATAAEEAMAVLQDREAALALQTEEVARGAARHSAAERLLADSRTSLQRAEAEATKAQAAAGRAEGALAGQAETLRLAAEDADLATARAAQTDEALTKAEEDRAEIQAREAQARAERSEAAGEHSALSAEAAALVKLVARDTAEGGQILDRLQVEQGFEKALGAALADDLRAPEVAAEGPSGWTVLPAYDEEQALPAGITALSQHVSVPDVLARRMSQVGLVDPDAGPALQAALRPGQRLVSQEGDLWRWDGFQAWAEDAPSAAALRLQQLNRLETLKQSLAQAEQRAQGATAAHDVLTQALAERTEAERAARAARKEADSAVARTARALSQAEAEQNLAGGRLESLRLAVTRHAEEARAAQRRVAEAEDALAQLADLSEKRAEIEDLRTTVEAARITMMTRRSAHDEMRRAGEARTRRAETVRKESESWRQRLQTAAARSDEIIARRTKAEAELAQALAQPQALASQREALNQDIAKAESRRAKAADTLARAESALEGARRAEREAERHASEAREARAGAQARSEAAMERVAQAAAQIADERRQTPNQLLSALGRTPESIAGGATLEADVNRLKRQRDALGAVNLRAAEDAKEVQTEHETLSAEKADLEGAIKALRGGIASLNREGRERLLTAFEQVNTNFTMLFTHLFGGGEANLVMVESDDPLEAGLEIMCQPPGKKLSTLSLLSGGEQTLTAMALIFAVFLANPAPICVLDEVDAPLDDANVGRFCDLLDEMCRQTETRFLIITHHAVTMSRMDRLFGVTMAEQGVSQLVSVDLKKAETLVA
ncbi:MAG: chromosome segregation protein SMC [Pseudomonadota bacterium]